MRLTPLHSFPVEEFLLTRIALSPDAAQVAMGHKAFRALNAESGAVEREFAFPEFLGQLRYSPDGRYLAAVTVATHRIGAGAELQYERRPVRHGETFDVGESDL